MTVLEYQYPPNICAGCSDIGAARKLTIDEFFVIRGIVMTYGSRRYITSVPVCDSCFDAYENSPGAVAAFSQNGDLHFTNRDYQKQFERINPKNIRELMKEYAAFSVTAPADIVLAKAMGQDWQKKKRDCLKSLDKLRSKGLPEKQYTFFKLVIEQLG